MPITLGDLEKNISFYTTNGKDIWQLQGWCKYPTLKLKNIKTGKIEDFGLGGITANGFHPIIMPEIEIKEDE